SNGGIFRGSNERHSRGTGRRRVKQHLFRTVAVVVNDHVGLAVPIHICQNNPGGKTRGRKILPGGEGGDRGSRGGGVDEHRLEIIARTVHDDVRFTVAIKIGNGDRFGFGAGGKGLLGGKRRSGVAGHRSVEQHRHR